MATVTMTKCDECGVTVEPTRQPLHVTYVASRGAQTAEETRVEVCSVTCAIKEFSRRLMALA